VCFLVETAPAAEEILSYVLSGVVEALHKECFTVSERRAVATGPVMNLWTAT
jgi:hypothetical protein